MVRTRSENSPFASEYDEQNAPQEPIPRALNLARPVQFRFTDPSPSGDSLLQEPTTGARNVVGEYLYARPPSPSRSTQSLRFTASKAARIKAAQNKAAERLAAIKMRQMQIVADLKQTTLKLEAELAIIRQNDEVGRTRGPKETSNANFRMDDWMRHTEHTQREPTYDRPPARVARTIDAATPQREPTYGQLPARDTLVLHAALPQREPTAERPPARDFRTIHVVTPEREPTYSRIPARDTRTLRVVTPAVHLPVTPVNITEPRPERQYEDPRARSPALDRLLNLTTEDLADQLTLVGPTHAFNINGVNSTHRDRNLQVRNLEPRSYEQTQPRILIGSDNWALIVSKQLLTGRRHEPSTSRTELGWVIDGSASHTTLSCGEEHVQHISNGNQISHRVLTTIPTELRTRAPSYLGIDHRRQEKTLELLWLRAEDTLAFNTTINRVPKQAYKQNRAPNNIKATSATIMSVFDLLEQLSRLTTTTKNQLPNLWCLPVGWDELMPTRITKDFSDWFKNREEVKQLRLTRYFNTRGVRSLDLHVLCDASAQAYVVYWRTLRYSRTVFIILVAGKATELIGARLAKSIMEKLRVKPDQEFYWPDLTRTTLQWIRNGARGYTPYISHRLGKIAELTQENQWRWIPNDLNIADKAIHPNHQPINQEDLWFTGPSLILQNEVAWPNEDPMRGNSDEALVHLLSMAANYATILPDITSQEELVTLLSESEYRIIARPLTHVSADPADPHALTLSDFLLGPSTDLRHTGTNEPADQRTWRTVQALADSLWRRSVHEYLPTLVPCGQPTLTQRHLQEGDLVEIVDPTSSRKVWHCGINEPEHKEPEPALDGLFHWPTRKLAVLTEVKVGATRELR